MPELSVVTDPNLPQPKGASTALNKQVYLANGSGGGSWIHWPTGWGFYGDAASAQTFNTTAARLSIDGAAPSTIETYLPPAIRGSASLWDTTNDKITPISLGDSYSLRLDLPITGKTGTPTFLTLQGDISGAGTPTTVITTNRISVSGTPPYNVSIALPVFVGSTFITNGMQFFLSTDTGTIDVTAPGITIVRKSAGTI